MEGMEECISMPQERMKEASDWHEVPYDWEEDGTAELEKEDYDDDELR